MGLRRKGRELALQTLYSIGFIEVDSYIQELEYLNIYQDKLLDASKENNISQDSKVFEFADLLLSNTIKRISQIDDIIKGKLINWDMERVADLDKNILRIAVYEIIFTDTPPSIIINEAIEISKKFCAEKSSKFINGVLDSISKEDNNGKED